MTHQIPLIPVFNDWLSMSVPVDPLRIPEFMKRTLSMNSPKTTHWLRPAWAQVKHGVAHQSSSSSAVVNFRWCEQSARLHINGNLGRWGRDENVWGVSTFAAGARFMDFMAANWGVEQTGPVDLSRVDLTANITFPDKQQAYEWLRWTETVKIGRATPKAYPQGTAWVAEDWSAKVYDKIFDLKRHKQIALADTLEAELGYMLRLEITLRTDELEKNGLVRLHDWMNEREKMTVIFTDKFKPLIHGAGATIDELDSSLPLRLTNALNAWRNGTNFRIAVEQGRMSRSTYQRLKRDLLAYSIDISMPCNVTNMRIRPKEIMPQFCSAPDWYRKTA